MSDALLLRATGTAEAADLPTETNTTALGNDDLPSGFTSWIAALWLDANGEPPVTLWLTAAGMNLAGPANPAAQRLVEALQPLPLPIHGDALLTGTGDDGQAVPLTPTQWALVQQTLAA